MHDDRAAKAFPIGLRQLARLEVVDNSRALDATVMKYAVRKEAVSAIVEKEFMCI
jgi:hypothetical protein